MNSNFGFLSFSAFENSFKMARFDVSLNLVSCSAVQRGAPVPEEVSSDSTYFRRRCSGESSFLTDSTAERDRYADESSEVEWCPTRYVMA